MGGFAGLVAVLVAGLITGSVLSPIKLIRRWPWENTWLVYSFCAYFLSPWIVAYFSIPGLLSVYKSVPTSTLLLTFSLGAGWGLAVVLAGLAIDLAGFSVSTALLYGSSIAIGSLGAIALLDLSKLFSTQSLHILIWDIVLIVGVFLCAQAGRIRDHSESLNATRMRRGIIVSLLAGVLSTLFNIVLAYGEPIRVQAIRAGANPKFAANAIWSLAVTGGSLPSILWMIRTITKNRHWQFYREGHIARNVLLCLWMGATWIAGTVMYSVSTSRMGKFGTALAWPVYMAAIILTAIAWGVGFGEWKTASRSSIRYLILGVSVQLIAISLLGVAK